MQSGLSLAGICNRITLALFLVYCATVLALAQSVCTPANSRLTLLTAPVAVSDNNLMFARLALLRREAGELFGGGPESPAECRFEVTLLLGSGGYGQSEEPQDFKLSKSGLGAKISSRSSLGLIYGFYEVLDRLGFRFASPVENLVPTIIDWSLVPESLQVDPLIRYRGFWSWGEGLDDRFLLWAGRNRFNLVGGNFADAQGYRALFGIQGWTGGHYLIPILTPTDRPVDGEMLLNTHPDWFGNLPAGSNPIPFGKDGYRNPCFGNPQYAEFFAKGLLRELASGRLGQPRFINVWPSDHPNLALSKDCARAPGSDSDLDDLLYFYRQVTDHFRSDSAVSSSTARPIIAGIGYYGTFDISNSQMQLPTLDEGYVHLYYNNVRSYLKGYFDPASSLNDQVSAEFSESVSSHKSAAFGVVDYHNYSVYAGMTLGQLTSLESELRGYARKGAILYAYMHPALHQPSADILLNRLISRIAFNGEVATEIINDFSARYFGGESRVIEALRSYDEALAQKAEFFGPEASLSLVLQSDLAYASPPLTEDQIATIAAAFLSGRRIAIQPIRLSNVKIVQYEGSGLVSVIEQLRIAELKLEVSLKGLMDASLRNRVTSLKSEIERSRAIHQLLHEFASARIAAANRNFADCRAKALQFQEGIANLQTIHWPDYLSRADYLSQESMKESFVKKQVGLLAFLKDKVCIGA
jgi:hypothetical protein